MIKKIENWGLFTMVYGGKYSIEEGLWGEMAEFWQ